MTAERRETTEAALQRLRQHFLGNLDGTTVILEDLAGRVQPGPDAAAALAELARQLHRLRGTAGTFGLSAAAALAGDLEGEVEAWREDHDEPEPGARAARLRRFIRDFRGACGAT